MNKEYLFWEACGRGWAEVMQILWEQGANIHADDEWALRTAAKYGHLEVVKWLVGKGVDIHTLNERSLRAAAYKGQLEVVKFLVGKGADVRAALDLMKHINIYHSKDIALLEKFL